MKQAVVVAVCGTCVVAIVLLRKLLLNSPVVLSVKRICEQRCAVASGLVPIVTMILSGLAIILGLPLAVSVRDG